MLCGYTSVVDGVVDLSGLSCVTDDAACAVTGNDLTVVGAVLYDNGVCSVVADNTACGSSGGVVKACYFALVEAVLEQSSVYLRFTADTAGSFRTGDGAFIHAVSQDSSASFGSLAENTAKASVLSGGPGAGDVGFVGDVLKESISGVGVHCNSTDVFVTGYDVADDSQVLYGTVHQSKHRNGCGDCVSRTVKSSGERGSVCYFIGGVNCDVGGENIIAVGSHCREIGGG